MTAERADKEHVLLVCTANVTRSPTAEYLLRTALDVEACSRLHIHSVGTKAVDGIALDPRMEPFLARDGITDTTGHRSRRLQTAHLSSATLILTMESTHRSQVVGLDRSSRSRAFTLTEFARLAAGVTGARNLTVGSLADLVRVFDRFRSSGAAAIGDESIADPHGRSRWAYRRAYRSMRDALHPVVALLNAAAPGWRESTQAPSTRIRPD
ncbi:hypothetical protein PCC79_01805 [Propioniciclava soli]|uniref:Phosphotyrosine protein phosphatase I domain-containing protein n=1 Tax=Propioniciclava soli TaxID=2775081 RepID=A0ABZ3CB31_9ACTN